MYFLQVKIQLSMFIKILPPNFKKKSVKPNTLRGHLNSEYSPIVYNKSSCSVKATKMSQITLVNKQHDQDQETEQTGQL